jgi:formimidoylglutamate deiminase
MANSADVKTYQFQSALIGDQWVDRPIIRISDGLISAIQIPSEQAETQSAALSRSDFIKVIPLDGVALPGMVNVHSHAFQRSLAGLSEFRTAAQDSFWTWRTQMYDFVRSFQPDDVYQIAKQLYRELLAGGYTTVAEFHYLHANEKGRSYSRLNELSHAVAQAAGDAGINFCLIPVLYQQGGFGRPLEDGQKRFFLTVEQFFELIESTVNQFGPSGNFHIAMALHSLRAVEPSVGREAVKQFQSQFLERPIHIHVAEQTQEVDDCVDATGMRSIEYLFDQFEINKNWCLIHCTQSLEHELSMIAQSGAVVGLCPTTEANLGDGIFPAREFLSMGGRIAIGTDSQVANNPAAEFRMLEYSQRLKHRQRCVLATETQSVGRRLFSAALLGGTQATGISTDAAIPNSPGTLSVGQRADLIVIDPNHPSIGGVNGDRLLDRWIFCDFGNPVSKTMVGGKWISD